MNNTVFVGVDIGGSHISAGLIDSDGNLKVREEQPVKNQDLRAEELVSLIANSVGKLLNCLNGEVLGGIGIGMPGQSKNGVLVAASNFPLIRNVSLVDLLHLREELSGVPIVLLNDADAAISAEVWGNASKASYSDADNIAMITLGTGVGLGLVIHHQLYRGSFGNIEGGHLILDSRRSLTEPGPDPPECPCGQAGCAEMYCSAANIARIYEKKCKKTPVVSSMYSSQWTGDQSKQNENKDSKDPSSVNAASSIKSLSTNVIVKDAKQNGSKLTEIPKGGAKLVFDQAAKGDPFAIETLDGCYRRLAILCINLCRILDVHTIVLGGGMAKAGDVLLQGVRKYIQSNTWVVLATDVSVVLATENTDAGTVGAALAAKKIVDRYKNSPLVDKNSKIVPLQKNIYFAAVIGVTIGSLLTLLFQTRRR